MTDTTASQSERAQPAPSDVVERVARSRGALRQGLCARRSKRSLMTALDMQAKGKPR
jgi:hypothetical protein